MPKPLAVVRMMALIVILLLVTRCGGAETPTAPPPENTQVALSATEITEEVTQAVQPTETSAPTEVAVSPSTCPQNIMNALTEVDLLCSSLGRNQVCYGNTRLEASPEQPNFAAPGDMANIADIQRLNLELDQQTESWGVALMRLQANLPDTLPGQNVTVVLFGNVQFDVAESASNTQAFYVQTGFGDAPCPEAPDSGLLIQTPQGGREVAFTLNGVDIGLGSTAYFQAAPGSELVTSVIEGAAHLTSQGVTKVVPAGLQSSVPLDAAGIAAGPPSEPEPYNPIELFRLPVGDLTQNVDIASPLLMSTFDADAEDWITVGNDAPPIEYVAGENSGSSIVCATSQTNDDNGWFFSAPDAWLTDMSAAYGGNLVYGQNQGELDNQLDQRDKLFLISNTGLSLSFNAGQNPAANYTVYTVPLIETAGWVHPGTNIRATEGEFRDVLADLAAVQILGEYRRGDNTSCLDFVLVNEAVAVELASRPSEPLLMANFDTDAEGWMTNEDGSTPVEYFDEGYVCGTDQDFIDAWYFSAGENWLGDQSAAYGGALTYELNQSATDGIQNTVPYNVVLVGSEATLQYRAVGNPGTDFTRYVVPLVEVEGWQVAGRDEIPTQAEMREVLSDLQALRIIGEFRGDEDTGCLNEAALYPAGWRGY